MHVYKDVGKGKPCGDRVTTATKIKDHTAQLTK